MDFSTLKSNHLINQVSIIDEALNLCKKNGKDSGKLLEMLKEMVKELEKRNFKYHTKNVK